MHKSVHKLVRSCAYLTNLYTPTIPQHILCGYSTDLHTVKPFVLPTFYTSVFYIFNQLIASYTLFSQGLLLKQLIRINNRRMMPWIYK